MGRQAVRSRVECALARPQQQREHVEPAEVRREVQRPVPAFAASARLRPGGQQPPRLAQVPAHRRQVEQGVRYPVRAGGGGAVLAAVGKEQLRQLGVLVAERQTQRRGFVVALRAEMSAAGAGEAGACGPAGAGRGLCQVGIQGGGPCARSGPTRRSMQTGVEGR